MLQNPESTCLIWGNFSLFGSLLLICAIVLLYEISKHQVAPRQRSRKESEMKSYETRLAKYIYSEAHNHVTHWNKTYLEVRHQFHFIRISSVRTDLFTEGSSSNFVILLRMTVGHQMKGLLLHFGTLYRMEQMVVALCAVVWLIQ